MATIKVINRAKYERWYLVHKAEFPAQSVVLIDGNELDFMRENSALFQQLVEKGHLVVQGVHQGKARVTNNRPQNIVIRYPLVLLKSGENTVDLALWQKVLKEPGANVWALQGQPDGLVFTLPETTGGE